MKKRWSGLPEASALAYLASSTVEMYKKGWDKCSSLLSFIITDEEEKSWRGLQGIMLQLICPHHQWRCRKRLEKLVRDKCSSLFDFIITDEEEKVG
jgi:hypothetical protein